MSQEEQVHFCCSMCGCRKSINYSSTITRHSYTTSLILLAIAFSLSSFTLLSYRVSYCQALVVTTLPSLLAKTQSPISPTWLGSCLLYLVGNILKEDGIGWVKPIASQLLCSSDFSVFSKVCVLWWGFQPWSTDWCTHHNCQIFYAVQTHSPYPHASFWRLYCHFQGCGAECGLHVRLFLARRLFDVSSFNSQVSLQSVQTFWQLQPSDNKCISMVVTSFWYTVNICFCHSLFT